MTDKNLNKLINDLAAAILDQYFEYTRYYDDEGQPVPFFRLIHIY